MENLHQDDTFLARWISGELTQEELSEFENSKDYPTYKKINDASQNLIAPKFEQQLLFDKIEQHIKKKEDRKVIKLIPNWAYAVAASVVLLLGFLYFYDAETQYKTGFGEQLAVLLPDNSKVQLNANSEIDFKSRNWKSSRELHLNGEAFFDVEKGQTFKVSSDEGTVEVLGTEFYVISREDYFEVHCQEGKVKVSSEKANDEVILLPGNAVRVVNKKMEKYDYDINEPNWLMGESTFENTPLSQVIISLENQFNISFDASEIDLSERFTGGFTHKNLNLALKTVTIPMDISYTVNNNKIILKNLGN